jgi:hypothetical protein
MPKESCYNCHAQHAKRDNVFLQFYPLLAEAAHLTAAMNAAPATEIPRPAPAPGGTQAAEAATTTLALKGLDPIALTEGREEMGKPEIIASHGPYRYQFVSEPNRARFVADPARSSIQNTTCSAVPGAPTDPALFAVYEKVIYSFATPDCVERFKDRPADYVTSRPR